MTTARHITQHIRYGLTPSPFGTLLPSVVTSYMLGTLCEIPNPTIGANIMKMDKSNQSKILKLVLRVTAVLMTFWWGLSHLFFPKWFFNIMDVKFEGVDFSHGLTSVAVQTIGVLILGIATASWLAASNPVKNKVVIQMLYIVGIGSILVFLYHIIFQDYPSRVWFNVIFVAVELILLTALYPWKESSQ